MFQSSVTSWSSNCMNVAMLASARRTSGVPRPHCCTSLCFSFSAAIAFSRWSSFSRLSHLGYRSQMSTGLGSTTLLPLHVHISGDHTSVYIPTNSANATRCDAPSVVDMPAISLSGHMRRPGASS